jgi:hypothetical protein
MNNMPLIEACFQEFRSKLKETNKGFKGEIMKVLQVMNKQMFCLIKNHMLIYYYHMNQTCIFHECGVQ